MELVKNLFLTKRFFYCASILTAVMVLSYPFPILLPLAKAACVLFVVVAGVDVIFLFNRSVIVDIERDTPAVMSLGDANPVAISLLNKSAIRLSSELIDELPEQFQMRNFTRRLDLVPGQTIRHHYDLRPLERGEYRFGFVHVFVRSRVGLISRRISKDLKIAVPVYPSIIQMKKYEIKASARTATEYGVKKVRRIGHSYEFEHIKQYLRGDDYRSINWKATSRRAQLMVNQYEDEKSQQVYCLIDKSRVMHTTFNGLNLFDYAVNASLVISNIVLGKQDKAGLITFSDTPKALLKAERSKLQLKKIIEALYRERENSVEANYESMYAAVRKFVTGRCLMFLYTNFESVYALHRILPQLRRLNEQHLLVVIFFEDTEITARTETADSIEDVYMQATIDDYTLMKYQLVQELRRYGIISMLTKPEQLTVTSINKYLELKSRGMI